MMSVQDVLREMRSVAASDWAKEQGEVDDLNEWADTIEAAMREPVAEVVFVDFLEDGAVRMIQPLAKFGPGTKLYALPPDAAAEIERLQAVANRGGHLAVASAEIERLKADAESCRKDAERMREALAMIATATTEDGCTCDNGYTPMWVAEEALAGEDV
jgi:hypothetical protein